MATTTPDQLTQLLNDPEFIEQFSNPTLTQLRANAFTDAILYGQSFVYHDMSRELEYRLREHLDTLLAGFAGRFFVLPVPIDIRLEHPVARDDLYVCLEFERPIDDWQVAFPLSMAGDLRSLHPHDLYSHFKSLIRSIYSDKLDEQDNALFRRAAHEITPIEGQWQLDSDHARLIAELQNQFRSYYRNDQRFERFFSLRDYEAEEAFYFPPRNPTRGYHVDDFQFEMLNVGHYRQPECTAEQIAARETIVVELIKAVFTNQSDPRTFINNHERYQQLLGAEQRRREPRSRRAERLGLFNESRRWLEEERHAERDREMHWARATMRFGTMRLGPRQVYVGWDLGVGELVDPQADARGEQLLVEQLTEEQRNEYYRCGRFYVIGGQTGNMYEITKGRQQNVYRVDKKTKKRLAGLCFLPAGNLCIGDTMLTQKITLELEEEKALKVSRPFGAY